MKIGERTESSAISQGKLDIFRKEASIDLEKILVNQWNKSVSSPASLEGQAVLWVRRGFRYNDRNDRYDVFLGTIDAIAEHFSSARRTSFRVACDQAFFIFSANGGRGKKERLITG